MTLARLLAIGFIFEGTAQCYVKDWVYRAKDQPNQTCNEEDQAFEGQHDCENSCVSYHNWYKGDGSRRRGGFGDYLSGTGRCVCYPGTLAAQYNPSGMYLCKIQDGIVDNTTLCEVDGTLQMSMSPINAIAMLLLAAPP